MKKRLLAIGLLVLFINAVEAQFTNDFKTYSTTNTSVFSGNNFKAVWVGKGNQIWAGTQYQGLYTFNPITEVWSKSSALTNVFINQIQSDRDSGIWVAQSGTSGTVSGGSNTAGGVNYFPNSTDEGMQFFSTTSLLSSRNVRSVYLDTFNAPPEGMRRTWAAQATFVTSSNTSAGGIVKWQTVSNGNFQRLYNGLQVFPNTNLVSAGTPSCYTVSGNKDEVYVGVETNYTIATGSTTQILKYDARTGSPLGGYDQNGQFDNTRLFYNNQPRNYTDTSMKGVLPAGFRTTAMYTDVEGRLWVGLRSGGVAVKMGAEWRLVNMPQVMTPGAMVNFNAITGDEFGYVYIGTNNGLVVFANGGEVTDTAAYIRVTTNENLPSNNVTGLAYDKAGGRMIITSDAGVTFWKLKYKIDVKMQWDYSFPNRTYQPIGVAAEGVSRIYLKMKKASDTLPPIKELNLTLKNFSAAQANTRGKLKKALVIDKYSEEASSGTSSEVTITDAESHPGAPGEFWFWYVSPDDFCNDSLSSFANLRKRFDTITIIATYLDNRKDTMDYKIAIVRPPTLFVHGLASSPEAWDNLNHNYFGTYVPFVKSPIFTYKRALKMDPIGVFQKNAAQLLGGDLNSYSTNEDRENTLQGCLDAMRGLRFAANQVDYICHSMGGIMIRSAIGLYPAKFYAKAGDPYKYKTYEKGFTHKIITLNTPHNSSPIADIVDQFLPLAPIPIRLVINDVYNLAPGFVGGFFKPVGAGNAFGTFQATDAVNNLQVTDARGGVALLKTHAKYHMLISNLNWTRYQERLGIVDDALGPIYKSLLQITYLCTYDPTIFDPSKADETRNFLTGLLTQESPLMIANFLNWAAEKKGYSNYISNSDGIVPLPSERAQESPGKPYISQFYNTDTAGGKAGFNSFHTAIMFRNDYGQRVLQLLNTKLTSPLFGDEIPANNDPEPSYLMKKTGGSTPTNKTAAPVTQTFFNTNKIQVNTPVAGSTVSADSLINIKFTVKDTNRLAYVSLNFQGMDSFRVAKTLAQQTVAFRVDPRLLSSCNIYATAVYANATNSGLDYYVDTFSLRGENLAPLQGFRLKKDLVEIKGGEPYYPEYEAQYNNVWIRLPNNDPDIMVAIDSVNTVNYDLNTRSFNGLKNGNAIANFTYKTLLDSFIIKVVMPYNSNCVNSTITSGSFRNAAIWSKGIVPDVCDSVIIGAGHIVTIDTSITIRALRINNGGTLTSNNTNYTLQIGQTDEGFAVADNYGTLNIGNGSIVINGRIKHNASSTFNMSGGGLTIDANKGSREMSVGNGVALFEAAAGMTSFNFSAGTLRMNNPPFGAESQSINCPYDFGDNSTLILGINTSAISSNNADGFGGMQFPNKIGKLIIDAGTKSGNRQLVLKKPLNVKGAVDVKPGSGIILKAPLNVNQ